MNLAVLRISGPDSSIKKFKSLLPLKYDVEWIKGDKEKNGRVVTSPGFTATIADVKRPRELSKPINAFLARCKKKNIMFTSLKLEAILDIGIAVGTSKQFVASVFFSPNDLSSCAECGITLKVTAYPTSDE